MKNKSILIILVLIIITIFNLYLLNVLNQATLTYKHEDEEKTKQIVQLMQQMNGQKLSYEDKLKKAKNAVNETNIIFGYIVGYLSGIHDYKTMQDPDLPEFAFLTVKYANEVGVSPYELLTICQIENGFNLHNPGSSGEQGPAQIMRGRWEDYHKKLGYQYKEFYNWRANYRVGAYYYSDLKKKYPGNFEIAVKRYNGTKEDMVNRYFKRFLFANRGISKLKKKGGDQ